MNRIPLYALLATLHFYVGWRLVGSLAEWPWLSGIILSLLVLSYLLLHFGLQFRRRARRFADQLSWASMTAMGLFSTLFVLTLMRDVLLILVAVIAWAMTSEFTAAFSTLAWPTLASGTVMFVLLSTLVITVLGMWNARRTAAIVNVDVPISGLPAALHGFTIAQISDIHVGPTIKGRYVDGIGNAVNRLNADMVAVTGDLVDGSVEDLAHHVSPLIGDYVLKACERTRLIARHDDTKRHLRQSPRLSLGSLKRTI